MVGVAWDVWGGAASSRFYSTPSFALLVYAALPYVRFGLTVKYVILGRLGPLGGRVHATMASPTRRAQAERRARAAVLRVEMPRQSGGRSEHGQDGSISAKEIQHNIELAGNRGSLPK